MGETLARFERRDAATADKVHWLWVVGPRGAVTTWFADTTPVIGWSVCDGRVAHSPSPNVLELDLDMGPCEFLESRCWYARIDYSVWKDHPVIAAYDAGDIEAVYRWLVAGYEDSFLRAREDPR